VSAPRLTVVVPVHNGAAYVGEAIDSVLAQRAGDAVELVAVDDGSTDDTPQLLAALGERIRVVRQANAGLSAARNAGIGAARGELLAFLDADDLHEASFAASFLRAADERPDADVFHCGYRAVDFAGAPLYRQSGPKPLDDDPFHRLVRGGAPHVTALVARRRAVERVGRFDTALRLQEDWDYWLRLAAAGCRFLGVAGTGTIVRRRRDSMSAAAGEALGLTGLAVLERHLAAHRRCPACAKLADPGLRLWRRAAVNSCARSFAERWGLSGRLALWLGRAVAVARRPRLLPGFGAELRARFVASDGDD
jgi:glycosyltransferase involved in cell wall biosynthesis